MDNQEENFMDEGADAVPRYTYEEIQEIVSESIIAQNVRFGRKAILYKNDMVILGHIMVAFNKTLNPKILNHGK